MRHVIGMFITFALLAGSAMAQAPDVTTNMPKSLGANAPDVGDGASNYWCQRGDGVMVNTMTEAECVAMKQRMVPSVEEGSYESALAVFQEQWTRQTDSPRVVLEGSHFVCDIARELVAMVTKPVTCNGEDLN